MRRWAIAELGGDFVARKGSLAAPMEPIDMATHKSCVECREVYVSSRFMPIHWNCRRRPDWPGQ